MVSDAYDRECIKSVKRSLASGLLPCRSSQISQHNMDKVSVAFTHCTAHNTVAKQYSQTVEISTALCFILGQLHLACQLCRGQNGFGEDEYMQKNRSYLICSVCLVLSQTAFDGYITLQHMYVTTFPSIWSPPRSAAPLSFCLYLKRSLVFVSPS